MIKVGDKVRSKEHPDWGIMTVSDNDAGIRYPIEAIREYDRTRGAFPLDDIYLADDTRELNDLRAFKAQALASGYVPPKPYSEEDFTAAKQFTNRHGWASGIDCDTPYHEEWEGSVSAAVLAGITWARENPR